MPSQNFAWAEQSLGPWASVRSRPSFTGDQFDMFHVPLERALPASWSRSGEHTSRCFFCVVDCCQCVVVCCCTWINKYYGSNMIQPAMLTCSESWGWLWSDLKILTFLAQIEKSRVQTRESSAPKLKLGIPDQIDQWFECFRYQMDFPMFHNIIIMFHNVSSPAVKVLWGSKLSRSLEFLW